MSQHEPHASITIDQEAALASGADRLTREFEGTFGRETIDRFLHSSYAELAVRATVANYLPLLTEKFARQRLRALAKVDGLQVDGKPTVLFLCEWSWFTSGREFCWTRVGCGEGADVHLVHVG
ncbi:MAG: hypothetical protein J0I43_15665 [Microbacterium sp.]|uniref:three-helix bundle dimerization domain-containing protein n=1 Tax=Microbacterium sp. TaxID=51671 RepID=UPI001AC27598|nr:hypothetical protein [Microbacterium sp.]MBN9178790.1 hypothetical protein [Microbacterium sp.]